jgi:hypothetical protein
MQADGYIRSIKRLVVTLTLLALTCIYLAQQDYRTKQQLVRFALSELVISLAESIGNAGTSKLVTVADLAEVSADASTDMLRMNIVYLNSAIQIGNSTATYDLARRYYDFRESSIENSAAISLPSSRLRPRIPCSAVILRGPTDKTMVVGSMYLHPFFEFAPMSDVGLVNFSSTCTAGELRVPSLLIFRQDELSTWVVGIPKHLLDEFTEDASTEKHVEPTRMRKKDFLDSAPLKLRQYFSLSDEYYMYPLTYYQEVVFERAAQITGHYRPINDIQGAMDDLASRTKPSASIFGLSTDLTFFVLIAPIISSIIVYLISRRIRHMDRFEFSVNEPWVITDTHSIFDRATAVVYAVAPLVAIVIVYSCFALIEGLGFKLNGRGFSLANVVGLSNYQMYNPGHWIEYYADVLLVAFSFGVWSAADSFLVMTKWIRKYGTI